MRLLAALLLSCNVALVGWQFYRVEPGPVVPALQDPKVPSLTLLAELESPPRIKTTEPRASEQSSPQTEASVTEPAVASEPEWLCFTLGPFLEPETAAALAAKIRERGLPASERPLEQREVSSYWVYISPRESRAEALSIARELAQRGVKDYYVVTSGESRNAVSLGLFSEQARADRRARAIQALGFSPEVEVRYRTKTLIWVDYDEIEGEPLPSELWADEAQSVQRVVRSCAVAVQQP